MSTYGAHRDALRRMRDLAYQIKDAPLHREEMIEKAEKQIAIADAALSRADDGASPPAASTPGPSRPA
jgi:hypothetical protein